MGSSLGFCRAWDMYVPLPGLMGDCEFMRDELESTPAVLMQPNTLYWITDRTPHESLPLTHLSYRQWFRLVTSPVDIWYSNHSTENPLGVVPGPDTKILVGDKFGGHDENDTH